MPARPTRSIAPSGSALEHLSPPIRCQLRGVIDEHTERLALRAVLTAARLLGLATGTHLRQLRNLDDPLATMQARLAEAQLHARLAWEIVELLSARFRRAPEKQRPHYSPSQRFRALEIKSLLGWSRDLAARVFLVCSNTISNWERSADPLAKTVGSNASGERSRTPRAFVSIGPSPSGTWSEGSRSPWRTTSASALTKGSAAPHPPRRWSAPTQPARRRCRPREDAPTRGRARLPSSSNTSIPQTMRYEAPPSQARSG